MSESESARRENRGRCFFVSKKPTEIAGQGAPRRGGGSNERSSCARASHPRRSTRMQDGGAGGRGLPFPPLIKRPLNFGSQRGLFAPHEERADSLNLGMGQSRGSGQSGYSRRGLVETTFSRYKKMFGERAFSRTQERMIVENRLKCVLLNKMIRPAA